MKLITLLKILFSVFILAIGGFALYEYRNSTLLKDQKEESQQLLSGLKMKDVKAIRFQKNSTDKLSLIKKGEDWFLLEPVEDLASFTELSRWFDTIARHKTIALDLENQDASEYHIKALPSFELELKSGEQIQFSISSKSSFDGRWFIKKGGQIFLAEQGIDKELQTKNLEDFRSKKILPSLNHATQIQIKAKETLTLNWKDYQWSLEGREDSELPLDQSFLNSFWTKLTSLSASSLLESKKEIKKYKLHKPALRMNLFYGEKKYVLKLSPVQEDKLYAVISHRDPIFEISKEEGEELFLSKEELYDHSFPFDFESPLVSQIVINQQGVTEQGNTQQSSLSLKKKKEKWMLVEDSNKKIEEQDNLKKETVKQADSSQGDLKESQKEEQSKDIKSKKESVPDPDKIQDFLNQLKNLKSSRYKKSKLAKEPKALRSIQLKNSNGELIFELKELKQSKKQSWLKSSLWSEWIALPHEEVNDIFNSSFLKEK